MFPSRDMAMASPSSIFSAYASLAASIMLLRTITNDLIPQPIRGYLTNTFSYFFKPRSNTLTLTIEEYSSGIARNHLYDAAEVYLSSKITPQNERLSVSKSPKEKKLSIRLEKGEELVDWFNGVKLNWKLICSEFEKGNGSGDQNRNSSTRTEKKYFELSFDKKHKEMVVETYLLFILEKEKEMKDEERVLKMHTLNTFYGHGWFKWDSINLDHPSTFETVALEAEVKNRIMEDLNRFLRRREFYRKVGRAWKRGYLLYGPPGTGKSSLIAAIANYLKFDIYDLQLDNLVTDSDLRKLLLATSNRSILVIEDIDCSVDLPGRRHADGRKQQPNVQLSLGGLLNFIDGLWSSCGDERIIILTTNHKERLDPALLRPGRMDMHIHMSYCSYHGFKVLASNYLDISLDHHLFGEIEGLIEDMHITPAQVAEELMKSEDAEVALEGFLNMLKRKKTEGDVCENDGSDKTELNQSKRSKVGCKEKRPVSISKRKNSPITQRRTRGRTLQ